MSNSISDYFGAINDPRRVNSSHPLASILATAICGVISRPSAFVTGCGADSWVDIEMFGKAKQAWLETFLDLPHGIPAHDTFGRVFRQLW